MSELNCHLCATKSCGEFIAKSDYTIENENVLIRVNFAREARRKG